jgi:molybdate transport system substrate-binding protein
MRSLSNVVSYEENVKAVVPRSLLVSDAGIVYLTDVTADAAESVSKMDIPDELKNHRHLPRRPSDCQQKCRSGTSLVNLVLSSEGQTILAKYGFVRNGTIIDPAPISIL